MAFGQTLKEKPVKTVTADGEQPAQSFEWQWIPLNGGNKKDKEVKGGARKIRLLPAVKDGALVIDENGHQETDTEVRFLEVWMEVSVDGNKAPRRIILDWRNRFGNPYWNLVAKPTEKGSPERKAMRDKFAMNVVDLTPVLQDENGGFVYPDENGEYRLSAQGKFVPTVEGKPTPLRRVRILEQSAGDAGGKHFLQQLADTVTGLEDSDGEPRQPHEVDLIIKVTGVDVDTRRHIRATANFTPLPDELVFAPRYDLNTWLRPWPEEAVTALINGADYNEVVEQFGIQVYPELTMTEEPTPVVEEPVVEKKSSKAKGKVKTDEPLFDD